MIKAGYKSYIETSHERCKKFGIKPEQIYSKKIISDMELQNRINSSRNLILCAVPYMEKLMSFVQGFNFFILLTDMEGCILNAIGDKEILSQAFSIKMIPGAFMNEESIGTNAISSVINTNEPACICGKEHFINKYYKWTCYASPIKDNTNKIIGILNFTGYNENVNSHTFGMVISASDVISEKLKRKSYCIKHDTDNKYKKTVFNSIPLAIITSDIDGKIGIYNKKASEMFENNNVNLEVSEMKYLLKDWDKIKNDIYSGKNFSWKVNIITSSNKLQFQLTANPIYNSKQNTIEIIYVFQKIKTINKNKSGQAYYTFDKIVGQDANFIKVVEYAKKIANSKSTILIMGESGTGKELFAQSIHNYSNRVDGPFVALNCGAIPKQLIESELFGYEDGSFTGAKKGGNPGKFELANGGTIMLDEIGEMPLDMQTKLLRVVQEGIITRIGGSKPMSVDVRIIAVTNRDLKIEVELGRFRKDLYYRLNVLPIYLPPLRERKSDILPIIKYFINKISKKSDKKNIEIPEKYLKKMINYKWPGNVRELENLVNLLVNTNSIPLKYFGKQKIDENNNILNIKKKYLSLEYVEKEHIVKILKIFNNNITHSAKALGIRRNTLYNKIKKYNIKI
ncbi:sigma-54 interaction domain-containing protein [Clostridium tyrobutyricum]|uniref:sigma-54 interaction domain-containing protein n=1 Tax=Clostridium tyrobutyricum TaxID=1519 RepID=UPI0011C9EEEE|nr:sigma 54-interacting transcriptional regulator [Clostridium tyrobutyricum]